MMNKRVSNSNTISEPFQRGWAKIRIRSVSPQWLWRCQSSGYRQLCSLWFEYDLCLNRKPPSDHKSCLMTLIRIRSTSDPKGVKLWFRYDQEAPKWVWQYADQVGIDSYVLSGSNMTYVWTGSPQVIMARFRYDHKPDQRKSRIQMWSAPCWLFPPPDKEHI